MLEHKDRPKNSELPRVRVSEKLRKETEQCAEHEGKGLSEYVRESVERRNTEVTRKRRKEG